MQARGFLRAGRVGAPHGLDGSVHVVEALPQLLAVGESVLVEGAWREIVRVAGHERRLIIRLAGCEDRPGAERLRGAELQVSRDRAPALEPEEWWADELEGCAVHDGELPVGVVRRLLALPSCELLEVEREGRPDLLVPLVSDAVRSVDVGARRIEVDLAFLGEEA